jgi:hypothetical protein
LDELAKPERIEQIRADYSKRLERIKNRRPMNPLRSNEEPLDLDDLYGSQKVCLTCHK